MRNDIIKISDVIDSMEFSVKSKARLLCFIEVIEKMLKLDLSDDMVYQVTGFRKEDLSGLKQMYDNISEL